jgi:nucleoside 2-deoxyribosyltransferase
MSSQSELAVYLAARYSRKLEIKEKSLELESLGINMTSRWLDEEASPGSNLKEVGDDFCREVAKQDIEDIDRADLVVLFSENPEEAFVRGGRHFEAGYAHGTKKPLIVLGPRENVFHYLNSVVLVDSWESLKANLVFLKQVKAIE